LGLGLTIEDKVPQWAYRAEERLGGLIESHAPSPTERLKAVETLLGKGVSVSVRIDPLIPFLNDNVKSLVATLASLGANM
jgi:DNA repair photolyase